jgi:hypothetical protein
VLGWSALETVSERDVDECCECSLRNKVEVDGPRYIREQRGFQDQRDGVQARDGWDGSEGENARADEDVSGKRVVDHRIFWSLKGRE